MICPYCKGKKQVFGHANYGDGRGEYKFIPCLFCHASGEVSDDHAQWIEEGQKRRADRLARGMTIYEEAEKLGITSADLSRIELGLGPRPSAHSSSSES